jgi:hypothetical protein
MGILSFFFNKLYGQVNYNPDTYEEGLIKKFPNNTKLVKSIKNEFDKNNLTIIDQVGNEIIDENIISAQYLKENIYEVTRLKNNVEEKGLFKIGEKIDWEVKTPTERYLEEIKKFKLGFINKLQNLNGYCLCSYPRIIDYVLHRHSVEKEIIGTILINNYLSLSEIENVIYEPNVDAITNGECKICGNNFKVTFYRFGEGFEILENKSKVIGAKLIEKVPNYTTFLEEELFCRPSIFVEKPYIKGELEAVIQYLFDLEK